MWNIYIEGVTVTVLGYIVGYVVDQSTLNLFDQRAEMASYVCLFWGSVIHLTTNEARMWNIFL